MDAAKAAFGSSISLTSLVTLSIFGSFPSGSSLDRNTFGIDRNTWKCLEYGKMFAKRNIRRMCVHHDASYIILKLSACPWVMKPAITLLTGNNPTVGSPVIDLYSIYPVFIARSEIIKRRIIERAIFASI